MISKVGVSCDDQPFLSSLGEGLHDRRKLEMRRSFEHAEDLPALTSQVSRSWHIGLGM